jgi:hypothetical protein
MITKTILMAGIALGGIAGSFVSAQAASSGVMDCTPHDWLMFGEAVENQDNEALQAMLSLPELQSCEPIITTVRILTCADDASLCPPPVMIPDIPPIIFLVDGGDDVPPPAPPGPFPNQRPGQPYGGPGGDNDEGPDGGDGGDGGDDGDDGASAGAGAGPAGPDQR